MTQTPQPSSIAHLNNTGKDLSIPKPQTDDIDALLVDILDDLNKLWENLFLLDYIIKRKEIELNLYLKKEGDNN